MLVSNLLLVAAGMVLTGMLNNWREYGLSARFIVGCVLFLWLTGIAIAMEV